MYFELGQENFQSSITSASVNHLQLKSSSSVMTLSIKCQYINDHYQLLV